MVLFYEVSEYISYNEMCQNYSSPSGKKNRFDYYAMSLRHTQLTLKHNKVKHIIDVKFYFTKCDKSIKLDDFMSNEFNCPHEKKNQYPKSQKNACFEDFVLMAHVK